MGCKDWSRIAAILGFKWDQCLGRLDLVSLAPDTGLDCRSAPMSYRPVLGLIALALAEVTT
jgi:hypothetical protein